MSAIEVAIKVSGDDRTLTQKYLQYESFQMNHDDPVLKKMVEDAIANFKGTPDDVQVKTKMVW